MKSNKPNQVPDCDFGLFQALIWTLPLSLLLWGLVGLFFLRACQ